MQAAPKRGVSTDKIIEAAGKLFAQQGYHATSTRQIANLADVSENTLFRHFENKKELFWSTLKVHSLALKPRRELLEALANCEVPELVFPGIVEMVTNTVNYRPELLRLIAVAFLELHLEAETFGQEHLSPVFSATIKYIEKNIKSGRLRNLDPMLMTAALMITSLVHPGISRMINRERPVFVTNQEASRAYARFWLELLSPEIQKNEYLAAPASLNL